MDINLKENGWKKQLAELNCCVIIPTYNNDKTIAVVIQDVLRFTQNIIVVNDGSTDDTAFILKSFEDIHVISHVPNKGKGIALRRGIKYAQEKGFCYAITIDSDGQHYASDIPVFINKIIQVPGTLLIGARNLQQENMPKKNTFGNRFSNFWFFITAGITLPDTQSGYRLYPLEKMKKMRFFGSKYEFEVEVMVKAAWQGIPVNAVPVNVFYPERDKRVSHFRPFMDFARISMLNTYLVTVALLWHKPVFFIKNFNTKNIKAFFRANFLDANESTAKKAAAVSFGVFMGIIPIWGYQLISALLLAHFLKLNKAIVALAANISIPPLIPFILLGSLKTGELVLHKQFSRQLFTQAINFTTIKQHFIEYMVGSFVFAVLMAMVAGLIAFIILKLSVRASQKTIKSNA